MLFMLKMLKNNFLSGSFCKEECMRIDNFEVH